MQNQYPIIIAEAGVNHNGSLETALKMVDAAVDAGVDYIKFQTFKSERLVTSNALTAEYQKNNCREENQYEMLRRLELSYDSFRIISDYCKKKKIGFLSTPFDIESIDFLASLGMDYMKIPSGEITNLPYLRHIARTRIPVIISTGMSDFSDIAVALHPFFNAGYDRNKITLLHCNTQYPTPVQDINLRAMTKMASEFNLKTGYSDHTVGTVVPVVAAALGAAMIEKHFTLDRNMKGPDHVVSLQPEELKYMVGSIKDAVDALGVNEKRVTASERENIKVARKSIVAATFIQEGELFSENNLTTKRPGNGISPMLWDSVIGKRAKRDFKPDDLIELDI